MNMYNAGLDNTQILKFEQGVVVGGAEFIPELIEAIKEKKKIQFDHYSFRKKKTKTVNFCPTLLKEYRNRWYLLGFSESHNEIRTFGLDRVKTLLTLEDYHEYKYEETENNGIGIFSKFSEVEEVVIKCTEFRAEYLNSLPLHQTQKIIKEEEGYVTFSLDVEITPELFYQLVSYGPEVQIIKPKSLKKDVYEFHKEAFEKY